MEPTVAPVAIYRFGLLEADVTQNVLSRGGVRVKIQEQPFRVLLILLARPGEIVTREELRQKLWPEGTYVDFDGSLNVIFKKLRAALGDDSDNPRFIETVPRHGYRFIAPVIAVGGKAKEPAQGSTLPAEKAAPEGPAAQPSRFPRLGLYGIAITIVLAAGALWLATRHNPTGEVNRPSAVSALVTPRKSVAVLGFSNITGRAEDAWLATAVTEMLNTELASGDKLRLIAGENVSQVQRTAKWSATGGLDQKSTSRLGTALNADLLVLGSYTTLGKADEEQIRLDVRLQDAATGEVLTEVAEVGLTNELFQIISRIGSKLRDRLHIPQLQDSDEAELLTALPRDSGVARLYALGISRLREFDALAAKDLLEQASNAEPKFALAHSMLARACAQLGYEQERRTEARKALDLSAGLPQPQQLLIEGDYYESLGNHEKAASVYHALFALYPDNVQYGLQLASAQRMAGHGSEALATIAQLRRLPPPAADDPNIDLVEARIAPLKADSLRLIRDALRKATAQGKALVYAQARHDECITIIYGENPQEGTASCEDAYRAFLAAGNRLAAADCIRLMADRLGGQGRYEEAVATYRRAASLLNDLGDLEKSGAVLNNMGEALTALGKPEAAEPLFRQARAHFNDAGDRANVVIVLGNLGDVLFSRGQLAAAAATYNQGLQILATVDLSNPGYLLTRVAELHLAQGNIKDAAHFAEQALAYLQKEASDDLSTALLTRGRVAAAAGDFEAARQSYNRSLEIRKKRNSRLGVFEVQEALAAVALDEGHPERAEQETRALIAVLEQENFRPAAAEAFVLLSKTLLAQNKNSDAAQAVTRAAEYARSTSEVTLGIALDTQLARVRLAAGQNDAGGRLLRDALARATRFGFYRLECEARLAQAEAELKGSPSLGRQHLTELASKARSRGMEFAARQAEQQTKLATTQKEASRN